MVLTTHCSLLTAHYSLLTTHYSLLTTHHSPLTTHYSLFTTHYPLSSFDIQLSFAATKDLTKLEFRVRDEVGKGRAQQRLDLQLSFAAAKDLGCGERVGFLLAPFPPSHSAPLMDWRKRRHLPALIMAISEGWQAALTYNPRPPYPTPRFARMHSLRWAAPYERREGAAYLSEGSTTGEDRSRAAPRQVGRVKYSLPP